MDTNEYEELIEYSEMTAFNFNSKEYQELKKEVSDCKNTAKGIERYIECLTNFRRAQRSC